jgi:ABC-type sugar transport system ATPase subunit
VLILDEPTGVLTSMESERLFEKIRELKATGTIILYISHRLEEVIDIADVIVVLKDGQVVDTMRRAEASKDRLVTAMVGRPLESIYPKRVPPQAERLMQVEGFGRTGVFDDVNFTLHRGEILGFFGLVGSGRTEVMRALFGADRSERGTVTLEGKVMGRPTPARSIGAGIGFLTEERKADGLALDADILDNASLASMDRASIGPFLNRDSQRTLVGNMTGELDVRPPDLGHVVRRMSGGNQQKVVLAKWLLLNGLKVLILDEPTRGVDIATKVQIYQLVANLAAEGVGIVMVSSEMPELLGLTHRICVMRQGRIVAEFDPEKASEHEIFVAAANVSMEAA